MTRTAMPTLRVLCIVRLIVRLKAGLGGDFGFAFSGVGLRIVHVKFISFFLFSLIFSVELIGLIGSFASDSININSSPRPRNLPRFYCGLRALEVKGSGRLTAGALGAV
jgi:hypothetical protein